MKKQQVIVAGSGIVILVIFYFFGNTVPPLKKSELLRILLQLQDQSLDIKTILDAGKAKLSPEQLAYVNRLENSVVSGDVKDQQIEADRQLADFWKDSVENGFLALCLLYWRKLQNWKILKKVSLLQPNYF